jgi:putative acetyltransferase
MRFNLRNDSRIMFQIIIVKQESIDLDIIRKLFSEYEAELNEDICFQNFEKELLNPLEKYASPDGILLLAISDQEPAGCIAFCSLKEEGGCEMKRLFVRPSFRNQGIGEALIKELMKHAKKSGYKLMRLDTLKKLQAAIRLYKDAGFREIPAYYSNPLTDAVYMEIELE